MENLLNNWLVLALAAAGWPLAVVGFVLRQKASGATEDRGLVSELRAENERLKVENAAAAQKAAAPVEVVDTAAREEANAARAEAEAIRRELESTQVELALARAEKDTAMHAIEQASEQTNTSVARLEELEAQAEQLAQANQELRQQIAEWENRPAGTETVGQTVTVADPEAGVVVAELEKAQAELSQALSELSVVTVERDEVKREVETVRAEMQQFEEASEARFTKLQELAENQVGKLQKENRELKAQMETLKSGAGAGAAVVSADGSAERLQGLTGIAPFGVFEANSDGKWTFANAGWSKIADVPVEDCRGDRWLQSVADSDRAGVESAWGVMVSTGNPFARTFRLSTPDGQVRWVAMRAGQVSAGTQKTFVGIVEDITERRRAEESARSANISLRSVVDASMESIVFLDRKGDITSWNRSAERMFGYTQEEALGRSLLALLVPDDQAALRHALATAARTDQLHASQLVEGLALCKDGNTLPVEISAAAWRTGEFGEEGEIRYTATVRDITERRRAEDMRRDKEAAEEANRAKSQFLANMSHELRTPLNAIIGFSEILHDRTFGDLTPKQERYVGNILSSGRHLLQLINDILDLSKVEAGHIKLDYVAFPVAVAIRNVEGLVKVLLQKKNLTLETEIPANLPVLIADQAKFKQVLYNLTSNAAKFTPEGGRITITASAVENGKFLQVDVTDTGIGIKTEDQDRIFREFEQVDSSYARMQQGTGLGLALVKRFVEMHGGRVRVFSEGEGKGTTFSFIMPFSPPEEGESTTEEGDVEEATFSENIKPEVLVVDDDQAASELLTHHLQMAGYSVSRAFSAADALVLAREMHPHVITLDVQLPDGEGWEVLQKLKADEATQDIPVLMVSILEDRERAKELGAADCFVKPVVKDRLLNAIAREVAGQVQVSAGALSVSGNGNGAEPAEAGAPDGSGETAEADTAEPAATSGRRGARSRKAG
ncbi:MAG: hypothetical protein OHK0029_28510 [Armatimonadaceae bacterium]